MSPQNRKTPAPDVRKPASDVRKPDRRVTRTQRSLRDALHSLIHERDYDSIVIKEILDRANVGRSAFYMHFRDKDELLVHTFHDILGTVRSSHLASGDSQHERLLWFSLPIFEHLDRLRHIGELKLGPKGRAVLHGHLQNTLAVLITEDVEKHFHANRKADQIPLDLLVRYIDSTFILVLNWWVENKCPLSPKAADGLFCSLVMPTLREISGLQPKGLGATGIASSARRRR